MQTPRSVNEREEVPQVPEQRIPCSLLWTPWWCRFFPCSPWKSMVEQKSTLQPMEDPMLQQVDILWRKLQPVESPHWRRLLAGPVTKWQIHTVTNPFLKDCSPWKGHMLEQLMKNCNLLEGPMLEQFVKDCIPWVGPHAGAGEESEEEGAAQTKHDELSVTPIPHLPALEVKKTRVKLSLGRREGQGEGVWRFVLVPHYPTLFNWQ